MLEFKWTVVNFEKTNIYFPGWRQLSREAKTHKPASIVSFKRINPHARIKSAATLTATLLKRNGSQTDVGPKVLYVSV